MRAQFPFITRNDTAASIERKLQPISKGVAIEELRARNYLVAEFGDNIKLIPAEQRAHIANLQVVRRNSHEVLNPTLQYPETDDDTPYMRPAYFMARTALYGAHHDVGSRSIIEVASHAAEEAVLSRVSVLDSREDEAPFRSLYFTPEHIDRSYLFSRPTTTAIAIQGLSRYLHDFEAL